MQSANLYTQTPSKSSPSPVGQIIAAEELEGDVVFGGAEGGGQAGAVAGWGEGGQEGRCAGPVG